MTKDPTPHDLLPHEKSSRVTILAGPYGSGKTEIAINRAFAAGKAAGTTGRAAIADLDIVNPYFRSRELRENFEQQGIAVLAPRGAMSQADLPALTGDLNRAVADESFARVVIDVGGDPVGARLLGMYRPGLEKSGYNLLLVVNPNRPFATTPEEIEESLRAIEAAAGLKATGLLSNPHLIDHTEPETVMEGHRIVEEGARRLEVPVAGLFYVPEFLDGWRPEVDCPTVPLERFMLPPWYNDMKRMAPYRDRRSLMG